jgi:predicted nucleic acid-binding protein
MKIYLDNCCFNRPYDDQNQLTIRLETEAKLYIQECIKMGKINLVWSYILEYENSRNPYIIKKSQIFLWKEQATQIVIASDKIISIAEYYLNKGFKSADAIHIACASESDCDYFITTDKGILKKFYLVNDVIIINPIEFIEISEGGMNNGQS